MVHKYLVHNTFPTKTKIRRTHAHTHIFFFFFDVAIRNSLRSNYVKTAGYKQIWTRKSSWNRVRPATGAYAERGLRRAHWSPTTVTLWNAKKGCTRALYGRCYASAKIDKRTKEKGETMSQYVLHTVSHTVFVVEDDDLLRSRAFRTRPGGYHGRCPPTNTRGRGCNEKWAFFCRGWAIKPTAEPLTPRPCLLYFFASTTWDIYFSIQRIKVSFSVFDFIRFSSFSFWEFMSDQRWRPCCTLSDGNRNN